MLPTLHEHFIEAAKKRFLEDDRFIGLLSSGSMIDGSIDEFSDLDLVIVYDSRYREEVMKERATR